MNRSEFDGGRSTGGLFMQTKRALFASTVAGFLLMPIGRSRAEIVCGTPRPIKPVHCLCGQLVDQLGEPFADASVKVTKDGTDVATVQTGSDGTFLFGELKPGSYELNAQSGRARGFKPFRSPIVVTKPARKCRRGLVIVLMVINTENCGSYVMKQ